MERLHRSDARRGDVLFEQPVVLRKGLERQHATRGLFSPDKDAEQSDVRAGVDDDIVGARLIELAGIDLVEPQLEDHPGQPAASRRMLDRAAVETDRDIAW